MLHFLIIFALLGAGIKFIDAAYDEKTFSKKHALIVAPVLGILWSYTMLINPVAATILLAIIIGVFFKGKIDNIAHMAGLIVILGVTIFAGVQILWAPLVIFGISALIDEVGNDFVDKRKNLQYSKKLRHKFITKFFGHRWMLKVSILGCAMIGMVPLIFFLAMVFFDYSYIMVSYISRVKMGTATYPDINLIIKKIRTTLWPTEEIENI